MADELRVKLTAVPGTQITIGRPTGHCIVVLGGLLAAVFLNLAVVPSLFVPNGVAGTMRGGG